MGRQWQDDLVDVIKEIGAQETIRLVEGSVSGVSPLRFRPSNGEGGAVDASWSHTVADDASTGDRVLALHDLTTQRVYVIARLSS